MVFYVIDIVLLLRLSDLLVSGNSGQKKIETVSEVIQDDVLKVVELKGLRSSVCF